MSFQLFSGRRPPESREPKRQPDKESVRANRSRLDELKRQNKPFINAKEIARLSFELMTPEDRRALFQRVIDLRNQIDALYADDDNPPKNETPSWREQRRRLQSEYEKLLRLLPDAEHQRIIAARKEQEKKAGEKYRHEFTKNFAKSAHEAVRIGIQRLAKTLEEIRETSGQLPTVILFPETSSRPLSYAIQPLINQLYAQAGQAKPQQQFVKIATNFLTKDGLENHLTEQHASLIQLRQARGALLKDREDLIRRIKSLRGSHKEREQLSHEAQTITDQLSSLNAHILQQQAHIDAYKKKAFEDVTRERLQAIRDSSPTGSVLVVDDVMSVNSRTARHLYRLFQTVHPPIDGHFFAFTAMTSSLNNLIDTQGSHYGIAVDHVSVGIMNSSDEGGDKINQLQPALASRIGMSTAQIQSAHPEQQWEFNELNVAGFPYRTEAKKEKSIGVKKDITSMNPFVTRSPERDIHAMRAVRAQYARWGQEAVEEWLASKADSDT